MEDEEADDGDADDDLCEKKSCKGFYLTDPGKEGESKATADATAKKSCARLPTLDMVEILELNRMTRHFLCIDIGS